MKSSANSTARKVKTPIIDSMNTFNIIGDINASIPIIMHASTTTTPNMSPTAMSPWPALTLWSENMNSGSVVPSATSTSPIIRDGIPISMESACALWTMKCALKSITAMLIPNIAKFFSQWSFIWKGLWKYCLSLSRTNMKPNPAARSIIPSRRDSTPFNPRIIGRSVRIAKYRSFLMIEL